MIHLPFLSLVRGLARALLLVCGLASIIASGGGGGGGDSSSGNNVSITTQPASRTAVDGAGVVFTVVASNATTYRWQRLVGSDWTDVSGASASTYSFSAAWADNGLQVRVVVTGTGGNVTSSTATLTVTPVALNITTDPQNTTVTRGLDAAFSVVVSGTAPSYRWQQSGDSGATWTDVPGASNATLLLPAVRDADNGKQLRVVVGGPAGSLTSRAATLSVFGNVAIVAQPANQSAIDGNPVSFSVTASDATGYQWQQLNGGTWSDVAGATGATYGFTAGLAQNGLALRVVVAGFGGPLTSNAASLSVTTAVVAPAITVAPQNATVTSGQTASFSVVASGTSPVYRWQSSSNAGASWTDVSGGSVSTLQIVGAAVADSGRQYRVVVSNAAGAVTSPPATLTVFGVLAITQQPVNRSVTEGDTATFSVTANNAVGYQWQRLVSGTWTDASGATGASYAFTAALADNGLQLRVIVTGAQGSTTSNVASLSVAALVIAPTISIEPQDQFVGAGLDALFSVTANGVSLSYRWESSSDGGGSWSPLSGGGASSYVFPAVAEADSGKLFRVAVSNAGGQVVSRAATLAVEFVLVADNSACGGGGCGGDSADGSGVGGGDGGSASAGPGLSAMRKVQVTVRKPGGQVLGSVALCPTLPCASYVVSLKPRGYAGPFVVEFADNGAGEYFDESMRQWLSMQGSKLRVMVPTLTHHISANPMTEAAYQYALRQAGGFESALTAGAMQAANVLVRDQLNTKLPGDYRTVDVTNFVVPITDVSPAGTLTNTHAGRYGAVVAGLPIAATLHNGTLTAPALSFVRQLSDDFKDDGLFNASAPPASGAAYAETVAAQMGAGICSAIAVWGSATMPSQLSAQTAGPARAGYLTLLAGTLGGAGTCDGWGTNARFSRPKHIAIDTVGNLYVADQAAATVRKISPQGAVQTLAGMPGVTGNVNATGLAARFTNPTGITVDPSGNVYVTDGSAIRRITPAGVVSTYAGSVTAFGNVDATGEAARFGTLEALASDAAGNVYATDSGSVNSIRMITPARVVTTLTTQCAGRSLSNPAGIAVSPTGVIHISHDGGVVCRLATGGGGTEFGSGSLYEPRGLTVDASGNIYVADSFNEVIRRISTSGAVTTIAGGLQLRGYVDGAGTSARFRRPTGVARDANGNVFIADEENSTVRRIAASTNVVTTFAGLGPDYGNVDGTGSAARFAAPAGTAVDAAGNIYTVDTWSQTIRKVTPGGVVSTLAGQADECGPDDGTGSAARFKFGTGCSLTRDPGTTERVPTGITIDRNGNLYVVDVGNYALRRITPSGQVNTYVTFGSQVSPLGVAIDAATNLYVSVYDGVAREYQIRLVAPGTSTVFARGVGGMMVPDLAGGLFVVPNLSTAIYRVTSSGAVSVFAGSASQGGTLDGVGTAARFAGLVAIAADRFGNLYVGGLSGGTQNGVGAGPPVARTIRKVTPAGVVTTVVGTPGAIGNILDVLPASLGYITSIAVTGDKQIAITSDDGLFLATFP